MSDILNRIVEKKREEVAERKRALPMPDVRGEARRQPPTRDFTEALRGARPRGTGRAVNVIAEIKRKSPSKGEFPWHGDVARQARAYQDGGAKAVSVVTDGPFFGGSPEMLREARRAVTLPVIQKEFVIEPWQVLFARALGADAVLLIAACLPGGLLADLLGLARTLGLHTLVEVTDEAEFKRADDAGAVVIGVNNRDLRTFEVDPARTERLLPLFRESQVAVCESGIHTPADAARMLRAGVDAFLIGEALMTAPDPAAQLKQLRERGAAEAEGGTPLAAAAGR
jgi:indole-3-glycerol phosphate synthase